MADFISIGSVAVDFYFQGDSLTFRQGRFQLALGGKYFTERFFQKIGGGGVNVAVGVAHHHIKSAVLGKIGDNAFRPDIMTFLRDRSVSTELIVTEPDYVNLSAILLSPSGERSVINYNTPHQRLLDSQSSQTALTRAKWVYLGNLPDVALTTRIEWLRRLHHHRVRSVVNLGINDCRRPIGQLQPLFQQIDHLIVNGHEFAEMVKARYQDIHFHEDVVSWYAPALSDKTVIVTEGKAGSYAYCQGRVLHQKAMTVDQVVDANGVGDGFTAGFVAAVMQGSGLEQALANASRYAAKIIKRIGAN